MEPAFVQVGDIRWLFGQDYRGPLSGKRRRDRLRAARRKAGDGGAVPRVACHFALAAPEGGSPARTLLASAGLRETTNQ